PIQDTPIVVKKDTLPFRKIIRKPVLPQIITPPQDDSIATLPAAKIPGSRFSKQLAVHPYFNFTGKPLSIIVEPKHRESNEAMFYALLGLLLFFSLIKLLFAKYFDNLVTLFFRVTMRQQQLREQLLGAPLPSLLLNVLFVLNMGWYLAFVAERYHFLPDMNFWIKTAYGMLLVSAIYFVKFLMLKITGWIFNVSAASDTYLFVVFLVNKMIGIFLIPAIILMAFSNDVLLSILIVLSYIMIGAFFVYRFLIAFRAIRTEIKVHRFHFFLYLCAFEIAPLMLIYKVLLNFVERSY
ncbi:MAG TPA: DUF4271 domain-containing protein, partial [Flavitalea sp.]|nr:DUF4271 domain-containing protein [Flavitalea sp.]